MPAVEPGAVRPVPVLAVVRVSGRERGSAVVTFLPVTWEAQHFVVVVSEGGWMQAACGVRERIPFYRIAHDPTLALWAWYGDGPVCGLCLEATIWRVRP